MRAGALGSYSNGPQLPILGCVLGLSCDTDKYLHRNFHYARLSQTNAKLWSSCINRPVTVAILGACLAIALASADILYYYLPPLPGQLVGTRAKSKVTHKRASGQFGALVEHQAPGVLEWKCRFLLRGYAE